ncbi:helix-turn-helix domain-containing protein [Priestia megaterium]|uniref:AraC family transcriptional regulator n=1 Tax=Priestia megaterium TaxID=1404 RepID=UPI003671BD03
MSKIHLKEKSIHGTSSFPLHVYTKIKNNHYFVGYHWHEEIEFIYVEEGVLEVTVNSESRNISKGNFIFISSGDVHQINSSGPSIHHAIVFHPRMLNFDFSDICQNNIIGPLTKGYIRFPASTHFDNQTNNFIVNKLKEIISVSHSNSDIAALSIKILLLQIIEFLYQKNSFSKAENKLRENQENIKKVIRYIQDNYSEKISLNDLASILNMNKNYFCKYFKHSIGKQPITYINEYRCEKAVELLHKTDLKILDISLMVGFDNLSYFIRKFKEYKRFTPAEYKKKYIL